MKRQDLARVLNKLAKWRSVFAGWQLGTRMMTDPESQAVRDHREATILLRVEMNTLAGLLIRKGVITIEEHNEALGEEAVKLDDDYGRKFPGFYTTDDGVTMTPEAVQTMQRLRFKP